MRKDCDTCVRDEFGDYCKHCEWSAGKEPSKWKPVEWWQPDTNADRIRAMSDEELAVFLADKVCHGDCFDCELDCIHGDSGNFENTCQNAFYGWLKQPAEVD